MILSFSLKVNKNANERIGIPNMKKVENLRKFKEITSNDSDLSEVFTTDKCLEEMMYKFQKVFFNKVKLSFPKIRLSRKPKGGKSKVLLIEYLCTLLIQQLKH